MILTIANCRLPPIACYSHSRATLSPSIQPVAEPACQKRPHQSMTLFYPTIYQG